MRHRFCAKQGFTVGLFDTMLQPPEDGFAEALKRHQPKLVAVYEDNFNFLSKMCLTRMRDIAFDMLEKAHQAGAVAIAHGSDASDHTQEYLERGFDYVLLGEAEWTLEHLAFIADSEARWPRNPRLGVLKRKGKW